MAYLKLFHGRESPDSELNGWGDDGPIFGPFPYFHTTYGVEIKFDEDECHVLPIVDGLVYYDQVFYGDWSVLDGPVDASDQSLMAEFQPALALFTLETETHQAGIISPDSLWLDLIAAHVNEHHSTVASMASALLEWIDVGGAPPEIKLRMKSLPWLPANAVATPITIAVCEALRNLARSNIAKYNDHSSAEAQASV